MEWHERYKQQQQPEMKDIADFIGNPAWEALNASLSESWGIRPKVEYSGCSMARGWNVKYKKSGKALCTLYPGDGFFFAMVVIGMSDPEACDFVVSQCSEPVRALYEGTETFRGSKWLMVAVRDERTCEDTLRLIELRMGLIRKK